MANVFHLGVKELRIVDAFYPPHFLRPVLISPAEMDARMDAGLDTFALNIPPGFQRDVLAGRSPALRLRFNPNLTKARFTAAVQLINQVTLLSIVLTGAAPIREREHETANTCWSCR